MRRRRPHDLQLQKPSRADCPAPMLLWLPADRHSESRGTEPSRPAALFLGRLQAQSGKGAGGAEGAEGSMSNFCQCEHDRDRHVWSTFHEDGTGKLIQFPSKCRVVGCGCSEFREGENPSVVERRRGDEMFLALQMNGITGDVASWLVDLALRVRRLEKRG